MVAIFSCRFYLVSNMSFYLFVLCIIIAIYLNETISVCKVPLGDAASSSQSPWRAQFVHVLHAAELNPRMPPADKQEPRCVCLSHIQMFNIVRTQEDSVCWAASSSAVLLHLSSASMQPPPPPTLMPLPQCSRLRKLPLLFSQ